MPLSYVPVGGGRRNERFQSKQLLNTSTNMTFRQASAAAAFSLGAARWSPALSVEIIRLPDVLDLPFGA